MRWRRGRYLPEVTLDPDALRSRFAERHERPPSCTLTVCGRLLLLGDDTGAARLPELLLPIGRGIALAAAGNKSTVVHVRSEDHGASLVFARGSRDRPVEAPWHRLALAVLDELGDVARGYGAHVIAESDLPEAVGLGSGEAFAAGLCAALLGAWQEPASDGAIARAASAALSRLGGERSVDGPLAAVYARVGHALRVDYAPPSWRQAPLPEGLAFVAAPTGEEAPPAARAALAERIVGARIAAAMLLDQVGLDVGPAPRLADVADIDVVDVLVDDLPEQIAPREVARGVELNVEHLVQLAASRFDPQAKAPVKRVARHLLGEAARVSAAEQALARGDAAAFGAVLDASHDSLRQDYRTSTPTVDRVCAAMRKAGAHGARMVGPGGGGGYAVAACPQERVAAVAAAATAASGMPAFEVTTGTGIERW